MNDVLPVKQTDEITKSSGNHRFHPCCTAGVEFLCGESRMKFHRRHAMQFELVSLCVVKMNIVSSFGHIDFSFSGTLTLHFFMTIIPHNPISERMCIRYFILFAYIFLASFPSKICFYCLYAQFFTIFFILVTFSWHKITPIV